uniref:Uncharacterized protein n=1 Tax=Cryptomonas curvata TaxID=233186 RepID=A0A7S0LX04_9CRYP
MVFNSRIHFRSQNTILFRANANKKVHALKMVDTLQVVSAWETILKQSSAVAPLVGLLAVVVGAWKYLEHTIFNRLKDILSLKDKNLGQNVENVEKKLTNLDEDLEEKFSNNKENLETLKQSMDLKLENVRVSLKGDIALVQANLEGVHAKLDEVLAFQKEFLKMYIGFEHRLSVVEGKIGII